MNYSVLKLHKLQSEILNRVGDRGQRVYTTEDFIDLSDRHDIEKALSHLVEQNTLRRIGRSLYEYPRISKILQRPAPPNISAAIDAIARRDNILILPDGIVAAHNLGLTNAVPARHSYLTDGKRQTLQIGGQTLKLRQQRLTASRLPNDGGVGFGADILQGVKPDWGC